MFIQDRDRKKEIQRTSAGVCMSVCISVCMYNICTSSPFRKMLSGSCRCMCPQTPISQSKTKTLIWYTWRLESKGGQGVVGQVIIREEERQQKQNVITEIKAKVTAFWGGLSLQLKHCTFSPPSFNNDLLWIWFSTTQSSFWDLSAFPRITLYICVFSFFFSLHTCIVSEGPMCCTAPWLLM